MTDAEREALVARMAEAMWCATLPHGDFSCAMPIIQDVYMKRARAALSAAEPVVREDEREAIIRAMKRRWKGGYPGEVIADLEAAIRARGAA